MPKTFSRRAPVAKFSLIYLKMADLSALFIFQYTGYMILHKFKCMFWHVLNIAQENKWCHWISELKLHLIDTSFIAFGNI